MGTCPATPTTPLTSSGGSRPCARSSPPGSRHTDGMTPATLYRTGRGHSPADPHATALLVRDGHIAWLGASAGAPCAERIIDLDGKLVTPTPVYVPVHTTMATSAR